MCKDKNNFQKNCEEGKKETIERRILNCHERLTDAHAYTHRYTKDTCVKVHKNHMNSNARHILNNRIIYEFQTKLISIKLVY